MFPRLCPSEGVRGRRTHGSCSGEDTNRTLHVLGSCSSVGRRNPAKRPRTDGTGRGHGTKRDPLTHDDRTPISHHH